MLSFKLDKCNILKIKNYDKTRSNYKLNKTFINIERELINTKNKLDIPYNTNKSASYLFSLFDPFKELKCIISKQYNIKNVSNAWLKMYELITYYDLIDRENKNFIYFDNASFPGSFIIATNYYINTNTNINNFQWYANSLINTSSNLEDRYELYKRNSDNYLMDEINNGDMTNLDNIDYIINKLNKKVDLYSSDLGMTSADDFNNQEKIHIIPNIGQNLLGLLILKKNGNFICKMYTFFESQNISLICILTNFFKEFYISKPSSSKSANSEIYLVGKGFIGINENNNEYIILLRKCLKNKNKLLKKSLICKKCYNKKFLKQITNIKKKIFTQQINTLNKNLNYYNQVMDENIKFRKKKAIYLFQNEKSEIIKDWIKMNKIKKLKKNNNKLNMK